MNRDVYWQKGGFIEKNRFLFTPGVVRGFEVELFLIKCNDVSRQCNDLLWYRDVITLTKRGKGGVLGVGSKTRLFGCWELKLGAKTGIREQFYGLLHSFVVHVTQIYLILRILGLVLPEERSTRGLPLTSKAMRKS